MKKNWSTIGVSVQGAVHKRTKAPNQDAFRIWQREDGALPIIAAVADGHGSTGCFRSDVGAKLAVTLAVEVLRELVESFQDSYNVSKENAMSFMPRLFLQRWRAAVLEDIEKRPYTPQELERADIKQLERNALFAYGTTLMLSLILDERVFFWQIGDGDILAITDEGELYEPIERDERLMGNETTSLCMPDAINEFRVTITPHRAPLGLVMMSTDGYSNSFKSSSGFHKAADDLLEMLSDIGPDQVRQRLPGWLDETSQAGSGDDISVVLIWSA